MLVSISNALGFSIDQMLYSDLAVDNNNLDTLLDADLGRLVSEVSKYSRFAAESIYTKPSLEQITDTLENVHRDVGKLGMTIELFDIYVAYEGPPYIEPIRIGLKGIGFQTYGTTQLDPLKADIAGSLKDKAELVSKDYLSVLNGADSHYSTQSIDQTIHGNRWLRISYDRLLMPAVYPGYGQVVLNYGTIRDMHIFLSDEK